MAEGARRTTETKDLPIASRTLLFASSECSMTLGGGKIGKSGGGEGGFVAAGAFPFATGCGFIRLGGAGESVFWRRRAEGRITEFERILVPYWCWGGCWGLGLGCLTDGVAVGECIWRRSLEVERVFFVLGSAGSVV